MIGSYVLGHEADPSCWTCMSARPPRRWRPARNYASGGRGRREIAPAPRQIGYLDIHAVAWARSTAALPRQHGRKVLIAEL
jgi:hypothetical protein